MTGPFLFYGSIGFSRLPQIPPPSGARNPGLLCGYQNRDVYKRQEKEGAAVLSGGRFRLTDYGMDVSNYVMAEFLQ